MYKLNVTSHFSSAHHLEGYEGACRNLHGHNWKVRIGVKCKTVDDIGMTIDFGIVKKMLNEVLDELDHTYLNENKNFSDKNPTSENIARYLFERFKKELADKDCELADVEIWESDKTSMIYFEE